MTLIDAFKNNFLFGNKYKTHSEAIIISCYFNPQNNPYRLKAFNKFYDSIKHLNHEIIECLIDGAQPQLLPNWPENPHITTIKTENLLWHKETLLNLIVKRLDPKYKYVFWVDADVIFTNKNWLVDSVKSLQTNNIVQPFEYCIHLDQDQMEPDFDVTHEYEYVSDPKTRHPKMWRSFSANHADTHGILSCNSNYDKHGHVGFAWGARREVLDAVPLYDRALVGGADHVIAHAAAGHFDHSCIQKSFTENLDEINAWSKQFYNVVKGKIGYAKGDLYHIWHGDIAKRQYLKRVQEFTPTVKTITERDSNGLHITKDDTYVRDYFNHREVKTERVKDSSYYEKRSQLQQQYPNGDDSFIESLIWGYVTNSTLMGTMMGGNMMGAMIGDALNNDDQQTIQQVDTPLDLGVQGNASLGGFDAAPTDSTDYTHSENFS